ncbi:MAG: hypothetical protein ACYCSO_06065 [Cuniculiplasma sp.]
MKVTRIIFIAVFSIICVFLIVSASSIYISAENDLRAVELSFLNLDVKKGMVKADFNVYAKNTNGLPSTISILNNNLTINPYSSTHSSLNIPINMTSLNKSGWPFNSITYYATAVISEFLNGIGIETLSRNVSTQMPFLFSNVSMIKNSNGSYSLLIRDMIPIALSVMKIAIYSGTTLLGNVSYANQSGMMSGNLTLIGMLKGSGINNGLSSLSMDFLGIKINL